MSMNTRSELEEERRLFYVALTRAEKQAYLTYTQSRYRWGKLIDAEPSRFIEEIEEKYLEYITPVDNYRYNPMIDSDIFGDVDKSKLRLQKPKTGEPPKGPTDTQLRKLRKIKPDLQQPIGNANANELELAVGSKISHSRFGNGVVIKIEGVGNDKKAEIKFDNGDVKKLLLRFAKLNLVE